MGFAKCSSLHHLRVLAEVLSRVTNTEQEHFQFHSRSSFSELPWIQCWLLSLDSVSDKLQQSAPLPALPKRSQFLLLRRSGMEQFLLPVSCRSIELVPLDTTCQGKQALKAAHKHLDIWVGASQSDPAVGKGMHRRGKLVLKWGNAVWNST